MQELPACTSPGPLQDLLAQLPAKQKPPHDLRDLLHMQAEHWAQVAAALGAGGEGETVALGGRLARLDCSPTLGQVLRVHRRKL